MIDNCRHVHVVHLCLWAISYLVIYCFLKKKIKLSYSRQNELAIESSTQLVFFLRSSRKNFPWKYCIGDLLVGRLRSGKNFFRLRSKTIFFALTVAAILLAEKTWRTWRSCKESFPRGTFVNFFNCSCNGNKPLSRARHIYLANFLCPRSCACTAPLNIFFLDAQPPPIYYTSFANLHLSTLLRY